MLGNNCLPAPSQLLLCLQCLGWDPGFPCNRASPPLRSKHERPRNYKAGSQKSKEFWKINCRPLSIKYLLQPKLECIWSSFEIQNRDNSPIWERLHEIWALGLLEESGHPFTNKTPVFDLPKALHFIKSMWPTLTDYSVPLPRLYLPIRGPQWWFDHRGHICDNFSCSQFHCMAILLEQLQAYGPEKIGEWGRSIQFKEILISLWKQVGYEQILATTFLNVRRETLPQGI